MRPAEMGQKRNDRIRVRSRRFKIKRFMLQPRNIDVRHNEKVVRRMVVRRQTIYPTTRCRREYKTIYKHLNIFVTKNTAEKLINCITKFVLSVRFPTVLPKKR